MDTLQSVIAGVTATWLGAVGVGIISVGLRLNNAVQRLTVIVSRLEREFNTQADEIRGLNENRVQLIERLTRLERPARNRG
ncbi:MAG: hypothetical protein IT462_05810 [Planctomycetes bacterium]|nr:hypothetical protein [Planctomycetota bacterium]